MAETELVEAPAGAEPPALETPPAEPAAAAIPAAAEPVRMRDLAREHAEDIVAEGGQRPREGPGGKRGTRGGPMAAAPGSAAAPQVSGLRSQASPAADPFARLDDIAAALPPEAAAQYSESVGALREWAAQTNQYAQEAYAQYQDVIGRIDRIAADPRFQKALEMVTGAPMAGADGRGAAGFNPADLVIPEEMIETEAERRLSKGNSYLMQQNQELTQRLGKVEAAAAAWQGQNVETMQRQAQGELESAHGELDAEFPELAETPEARQAWHLAAAREIQAQRANKEPMDVKAALQAAAYKLHYQHAKRAGAKGALASARNAARSSTLRESGSPAGTSGPPADANMRQIAEHLAATRGDARRTG